MGGDATGDGTGGSRADDSSAAPPDRELDELFASYAAVLPPQIAAELRKTLLPLVRARPAAREILLRMKPPAAAGESLFVGELPASDAVDLSAPDDEWPEGNSVPRL